jgi:hypothetical protein
VETVVVDQHDHQVFTPFLHQIATAMLEPAEVAEPLVGDELAKQALLDRLPSRDATERQAFDALRRFLAAPTAHDATPERARSGLLLHSTRRAACWR